LDIEELAKAAFVLRYLRANALDQLTALEIAFMVRYRTMNARLVFGLF
jgi:hypothetical protein